MTASAKPNVSRIDLWILGTMRQRAEIARRFPMEALQQDIQETVRAARSALPGPSTLTADAVRQFFGTPSDEPAGRLVYRLQLWPEHVYEWSADVAGRIMHSTFKMRDGARAHLTEERSQVGHERFEPWLHTESEVRSALGKPTSEEGWWPEHDLHYRPTANGEGVVFTFDHGLLTAVTSAKQGST